MFTRIRSLVVARDQSKSAPNDDGRAALPVRRPSPWQRKILRHRRLILAGLAFVATATTLSMIHPISGSKTMAIVATHDLAAGTVVSASDVSLAPVIADALPHDAITATTRIIHHALLAPMFSGDVIRQRDVLDSQLIHRIGAGSVAVPVHVATSAAALVQRGDHVDVLAGNPNGASSDQISASTVATDVVVLIASVTTSSSSMLGTSVGASGTDVVVIARPQQAAAIAAASAQSTMLLALRGADG